MKRVRDEWGVPHIEAETEAEAFRALGYAQAEDHLPRILKHYTVVQARAAATWGPDWIPSDRSQLRWSHVEAARRQFDRLPAADQALYHAFIDGVRSYIRDHPDEVSGPVPELHPALAIAVYRMFLWHFMIVDAVGAAAQTEVLDPSVLMDHAMLLNLQDSNSNQWVVMPQNVVEGVTVVLSDPHATIGGFPMFEHRVRAGRFNYIGVSTPGGVPAFLGHTDGVAWGSTTGGPRVSDCYLLRTRDGGREYLHGNEWRPVTRRHISLEVAGEEPFSLDLKSVLLNGIECPVIGRREETLAVCCTSYMRTDIPAMDETLLGWLRAQSVDEWLAAASNMGVFQSNFVAGDRYGDSTYIRVGLVPRRGEDIDCTVPIEGYDEHTRWRGYHSFQELVQIRNPDVGYMQNNNVAPDTMFTGAADSSLAAHHYRPYIFNDTPGRSNDRGSFANQMLDAGPLTISEIIAVGLEDRWPTAMRWRDALLAAVKHRGDELWSGEETGVVRELLDFNGECGPHSRGALAFYFWRTSIHLVCDPESLDTPAQAPFLPAGQPYPRSRALWEAVEAGDALTEEQQDQLLEAVKVATRRMTDELGRTGATFGDVFRIGRGENDWPARSSIFPAYGPEGGPITAAREIVAPLRVMWAETVDPDGSRRISSGGRSWRLTAFTTPIQSYSVVLFGQSSRPESPHFSDQCRLYSEHRVRETGFATLLDAGDNGSPT